MDTNTCINLARSLMTEHGVGYLSFGFHSYSKRMGIVGRTHYTFICNCESKRCDPIFCDSIWSKITLSSDWIKFLPKEKIKETILHEIAHAKCETGLLKHHGHEWQNEAIKLGIEPNAKFKWDGPVPWESKNIGGNVYLSGGIC